MILLAGTRSEATKRRCKAVLGHFTSIPFWIMALTNVAVAATDQAPEIESKVIAHLTDHGFSEPKIISRMDLATPFATTAAWTLVIAQDNSPPPELSDIEDRGPIAICFVKDPAPDCSEKLYQDIPAEQLWFGTPFYIRDSRVVYAGPAGSRPLLLLKTCGARSGDGNCGIATGLFDYDRGADPRRPPNFPHLWPLQIPPPDESLMM